MQTPHPQPLRLPGNDIEFLLDVARRVLGKSEVAATTAQSMEKQGIDSDRLNRIITSHSVAVSVDHYVFKKVEADPETPANFGLFVRLKR